MITEHQIQELTETHLAGSDRFIVEIKVQPTNKVFIYIDSDTSVTIEHCIELSRFIEKRLNELMEDFELNVSSAGIDQPLKLVRQYIKNVGRDVSVVTTDNRKINGKLIQATNEGIQVVEKKKVKKEITEIIHQLTYTEIKTTKEIIKFS